MPATATAPAPAVELTVFWVPLTVGGFGNTTDCYVMAEDGLNAKAAAVMAGFTIAPGAYCCTGIPREQAALPGGKVWNFGAGARARFMRARREGRIVRREADLEWFKLAPSAS